MRRFIEIVNEQAEDTFFDLLDDLSPEELTSLVQHLARQLGGTARLHISSWREDHGKPMIDEVDPEQIEMGTERLKQIASRLRKGQTPSDD